MMIKRIYATLKRDYPDAIILFKINSKNFVNKQIAEDFLSIGECAVLVSNITGSNLTGNKTEYMTGFSEEKELEYVNKIVKTGRTVIIYNR